MTLFKVLIAIPVIIIAVAAYGFWAIDLENPTSVTTLNPKSSGPKAIVIDEPGVTDWESRIVDAYASGLVSASWHVDVTTTSVQIPTDLVGYDLVVLCSPIYGSAPSQPMQNHLARLGSLSGVREATILAGAGSGDAAKTWMTTKVGSIDGIEVLSLALFSQAPNQGYSSTDTMAIAAAAAASINR